MNRHSQQVASNPHPKPIKKGVRGQVKQELVALAAQSGEGGRDDSERNERGAQKEVGGVAEECAQDLSGANFRSKHPRDAKSSADIAAVARSRCDGDIGRVGVDGEAEASSDANHFVGARRWPTHAEDRVALLQQADCDRMEDLVEDFVPQLLRPA